MRGQIRNQDPVIFQTFALMEKIVSKEIKNIFEKQNTFTKGSQHLDFDTGSHNSAPQVTRNMRRINNRFNVIVLTLHCLLDIKGAF